MKYLTSTLFFSFILSTAVAQDLPLISSVEPQPLLAQAVRLDEALTYLGHALSAEDAEAIQSLQNDRPSMATVRRIQQILDPYCLAMVQISPEGRVKVSRGPAEAELMEGGWRSFLVKVHNEAGVTAQLNVRSPNAEPLLHRSTGAPEMQGENYLSEGQIAQRFLEVEMYNRRPLNNHLSGLELEYAVVQVFSRDRGMREAKISFDIGQGSQDIGFRNDIAILFDAQPSKTVVFDVKDHDGEPTMASFIITDNIERLLDDHENARWPDNYRYTMARRERLDPGRKLSGIYPLPSRRLAMNDDYPDFFFQPQVYRADGETMSLPPGTYDALFTRGPEYRTKVKTFVVPADQDTVEVSFELERWVHMADLGWYSVDHHIHAAGCSHYESPEEGVKPDNMWRQVLGEDLNIGSALTWGPCWYYQKSFFTGKDHPLSTDENILRYDVEVSGFPSSHAGHIVLLRLQEDDYPRTTRIEDWPSWTPPILQWAKDQGGVTGYAHSGWGLEPEVPTAKLPNLVMPKCDGIGANEYIVSVTLGLVDFYSAGDTPAPWELNMWYHSLNNGFRTRLSGETDFPCIFDERVGLARSYVQIEDSLSFDHFIDALKVGRNYVSDGSSHLIDFEVNDVLLGTDESQLDLRGNQRVTITARAAAHLSEQQTETGRIISERALWEPPYWHLERARIEQTRTVPVELIVNGESVARQTIKADGSWQDLSFDYEITQSSWIALRIYPSSHTNPIFVLVDDQPIRASRASAQWSRQVVDQCWAQKQPNIRASEQREARSGYNYARGVYDQILAEIDEDD